MADIPPSDGTLSVTIPIPDGIFDDNLILDPDDQLALAEALELASSARLHLGAMLEVLQKCHPAHKIEAGLYVGNLKPIHERLRQVVDTLEGLVMV